MKHLSAAVLSAEQLLTLGDNKRICKRLMPAAKAEAYVLDVQRLLLMANPPAPNVGIWRLFIDESGTKSNDFYEIDDIDTFGQAPYIRLPDDN